VRRSPRRLARATKGSGRRARVKAAIARLKAREGDADVNAARNIAAGHAVTARGRPLLGGRVNREPQPLLLPA
jgi:hypothetical protein